MQILRDVIVKKARKKHKCDECLRFIGVGEAYHKLVIEDGLFYEWLSHLDCRKLAEKVNKDAEYGSNEWMALHELSKQEIEELTT